MGLSRNTRLPFNEGLLFQAPTWCFPSDNVLGIVNSFLSEAPCLKAQEVYSNKGFSGHSIGYLKVISRNAKVYFVKVIPYAHIKPFYFSLKIGSYYKNKIGEIGFRVFSFEFDQNKYFAILDAYYSINSLDICNYDVDDIVIKVSSFHQIMSEYPESDRVEKYCRAKLSRLERKKNRFLESKENLYGMRKVIAADLDRYDCIKDRINASSNKQIIHCDLNVGNLICSSGRLVFLDFEEAPRSFLPPIFDVAKIIERFILVRSDISDYKKRELVSEIMRGLRSASDRYAEEKLTLSDALLWYRQISWLVLLDTPKFFLDAGSPEVKKFLFLKSLEEKYHSMLERI